MEFRYRDDEVEIIENITVGDVVSRRVHYNVFDLNSDDQYFIKNHLGSTITMVDSRGEIIEPVFEYYPFGKQKQIHIGSESPVTQTFTGKELDLFEGDIAEGNDGYRVVL
ncbi:hypothetical protein QA601_17495, partial [Chitinispirillales bacterium ANBcel5]|uniref:hypothetical protein n=1 Tax=Cellulosispirillum alkaliphilum TaxID=3039283 RepID=UPI002A512C24|nr:hypothetical protein [Chitinispirillales bacterium ANBcel5]